MHTWSHGVCVSMENLIFTILGVVRTGAGPESDQICYIFVMSSS